jgi:hypothetical protein
MRSAVVSMQKKGLISRKQYFRVLPHMVRPQVCKAVIGQLGYAEPSRHVSVVHKINAAQVICVISPNVAKPLRVGNGAVPLYFGHAVIQIKSLSYQFFINGYLGQLAQAVWREYRKPVTRNQKRINGSIIAGSEHAADEPVGLFEVAIATKRHSIGSPGCCSMKGVEGPLP